jgi:diguanylate cyclase (GGDEF)-like protein
MTAHRSDSLASSLLRDFSAKRAGPRSLARTTRQRRDVRCALAIDGANDPVWDWDLAQGLFYGCRRWKGMVGLPGSAAWASPTAWLNRVHPEDEDALLQALDDHLAGRTHHLRHEHRVRHEDGGYRWTLCRARAIRGADGVARRLVGTFTDITEWASARERLRQAAWHDTLTGLPNRTRFLELLAQASSAACSSGREYAVLFVDLDGFKSVNDRFGHPVGDQLLVAAARRLESVLRSGDTVARLGGDEFVILLPDLDDARLAHDVAERIGVALEAPFAVGGAPLHMTTSIGIAFSGVGGNRPDDLIRDADTAMYRAKALGRGRYVAFDAMRSHPVDAQLG